MKGAAGVSQDKVLYPNVDRADGPGQHKAGAESLDAPDPW